MVHRSTETWPYRSKWIVEKCLKGDLIAGRTVILIVRLIILSNLIGFPDLNLRLIILP